MKHLRPLILLGMIAMLIMAPQTLLASQRVILLETFTNVSCAPCATANPVTHTVVEEQSALKVLNLQYHVSWPSSTDPFYLIDTADNGGRRSYYGVNSVPDLKTDGIDAPSPGNADAMRALLNKRLATDSPLDISIATNLVGNQLTVTADITAVNDVPASGLVTRIAFVEPFVNTGSPPGNNGESRFYCTMRDMLPSHSGTALSITNGQTVQVQETGTVNASWNDVYVIVWVQNEADKSVLQAASSLANTTDYSYFFGAVRPVEIAGDGDLVVQESVMSNLGIQTDSYSVDIIQDIPADWSAAVCEGVACYPSWTTNITVGLAAGEQTHLSVDFNVGATVGTGTVTLNAVSNNDPTLTYSVVYTLIHDGTKVLCVDDDGGYGYETYYNDALDSTGHSWAAWNLDSFGKLSAAELSNFFAVVWNVGLGYPTVEATDRDAIAAYLDGGGRLFMAGQDIGWDIFDPSGYEYGVAAQNWYRTYLGATYVNDDTNDMSLYGIASDPISDGMSFTISGGDGANNQAYPSEIQPYGNGVACLLYSTDREAAVRTDTGTWRSVYMAFGFEGISTPSARNSLMDNILVWFGIDIITGADGEIVRPLALSNLHNHPNPFNPSTEIAFVIDGSRQAPVTVGVYNLTGQKVRTLHQGILDPGAHSLSWDGRSDTGQVSASGVYFARVQMGDHLQSVKMTLTK
jgi:hypothetical protein